MITFKPFCLEDKEIITSYTIPFATPDCDFSFSNLCSWHFLTESSYAESDGYLLLRFRTEDNRLVYPMPIGQGNIIHALEQLEQDALKEGQPLRLRGIQPSLQETLEKYFPTLFEYTLKRDYFDYIYFRKDLTELKGKNYQPKRNHINKFKKEYPHYRYTSLTPELIPQCLDFEARWCMQHDYVEHASLKEERRALTYAIHHYEKLGLIGGVLWIEDKMVAFTFGSPINRNTFDVQYEKAYADIDGAYTIINQEFVSHLPEQYIYINREEDLGIPGLRQAKLSYHPAILLEKCIATKTNGK